MMERTARLATDPAQIVDLRYRMGKILDEQLGDRASAIDNYQTAIDAEPGHLPSLEALRKIHIDSGDWLAASKVLEQETQYQTSPRLVAGDAGHRLGDLAAPAGQGAPGPGPQRREVLGAGVEHEHGHRGEHRTFHSLPLDDSATALPTRGTIP